MPAETEAIPSGGEIGVTIALLLLGAFVFNEESVVDAGLGFWNASSKEESEDPNELFRSPNVSIIPTTNIIF